jgi:catechol 2,3-dioxygenase-like lactoylglutathione lyase family enzyme
MSDSEGADRSESEQAYPRVMGHIGLVVGDIEDAFEWYREVLGFTPVMEPDTVETGVGHFGALALDCIGEDVGEYRIAHMATGNHVGVELFEFEGYEEYEEDITAPGLSHFCLQDPNVEATAERIVEAGGEWVTSKVWDIFPEKPEYEMCYVTDPWGNVIELHSRGYEHMHANMVD